VIENREGEKENRERKRVIIMYTDCSDTCGRSVWIGNKQSIR
jgi:hypothetical protein